MTLPITLPIPLAPSRLTFGWGFALLRNQWLRMILGEWWKTDCLFDCTPETPYEQASANIGSNLTTILDANQYSRRVVVMHLGGSTNPLFVFESGKLVGTVPMGEQRSLPLCGKFAIALQSPSGETVQAAAVRYVRCECWDDPEYYDDEPVGGHLL